jgi:hypothetical protein
MKTADLPGQRSNLLPSVIDEDFDPETTPTALGGGFGFLGFHVVV